MFVVSNLPPGMVDLSAGAAGFNDVSRQDIVLEVGRIVSLDLQLSIGNVRETVVVGSDGRRRHEPVGGRRRDPDQRSSTPCRSTAATSSSWRCSCRATRRRRTSIPPRRTRSRSRRPASSAAAATSRSTAPTTTTTSSAGRCRTSRRRRCRSSRSPPTGSRPSRADRLSSVINIVTKSGTDQFRGSASIFLRDSSWQALPATYDRSSGDDAAVRSAAGRRRRRRAAGARDGCSGSRRSSTATRMAPSWSARATSRRGRSGTPSPLAPLDDLLGSARVDWRPNAVDSADRPLRRRTRRRHRAPARSTARSVRRRSARPARTAISRSLASWTRIWTPTLVNVATASFSTFNNAIAPVAPRPAADIPEHPGRLLVPRAAGHDAEALPARRHR